MADVVQYRLERMSDELDDLERRGLFSRPEIAEIVRRRRDFEYRLKRHSPLKNDYLSYIQYEQQLDALRNLRKKRIIGAAKKTSDHNGKKWKKSVSDVAGVLRILDVYRMVTMRYKGDLDLWFRYLEFCRERKHGRMKQVLAQAIRFHPEVCGLWIYAASWEFDHNLNVAAARALMQSGLRACPKSEDLWIEYLRMELTYLNKLSARKAVLGEDTKISEQVPDGDIPPSISEQVLEGDIPLSITTEEKENLLWQQGPMILQTIYCGAVESLPSSMSLRKRFFEILDTVDLANSDRLKEEVMEDLKRDFSHDEHYWDWRARLQIASARKSDNLTKTEVLSKLNKATEVYEEALNVVSSTKMFSLYAKFWLDVVDPDREDSNSVLSKVGVDAVKFSSSILRVYEKAELSECLSEDLACEYVTFYLQMERVEEARSLAEKLCNGKFSEAAKLWILRVSIEMKWLANKTTSMGKDDLKYMFRLLSNVLTRLPVLEAERLWLMAINLFSNNKKHFEKLVKCAMVALGRAGGSYTGYAISSAIVNLVLQRNGIRYAREMYKRFLALPHPSLGFFKHCIELESNLAFLGDCQGLVNARQLYPSALSLYEHNKELWKGYHTLEMKVGTSETANAVYWRARKTIGDTTCLSAPGHF